MRYFRTGAGLVVALLYLAILVSAPAARAAGNVSLNCRDSSFSECMKRLSQASAIQITYDKILENARVNFAVTDTSPYNCLHRAMQESGIENLAVAYDATQRQAHIFKVGGDGESTSPQQDAQSQNSRAVQSTPDHQAATANGPSPEQERLAKAQPDLDSVIEIPSGDGKETTKITLRQMLQYSEQGVLSRPDPDAVFLQEADGKNVTWKQFEEYARKAATPPDENTTITLPDGSSISLRELKEYQAKGAAQKGESLGIPDMPKDVHP